MNKKTLIIIAVVLFLGAVMFFLIVNMGDLKPKEQEEPPVSQVPNPASSYCEKEGGILEIRTNIDGSQRGFCLFDDGSECKEWKFFNSECKKGDVFCKDLCGDGICQEVVCLAVGCPCAETPETCPRDCL